MKKFLLLATVLCTVYAASAQTLAYTQDGKRIVIFQNGTWFYADSLNLGNWNLDMQNQSAGEVYNEAYDYAYDVVYGDEFFPQERQNKAGVWAADHLKQQLVISIGRRSLESWYDELYNIAYEKIYRNTFFGNDRKQNASTWAKNLLEQRATYEGPVTSSRISRQRVAYNLAYNKIFANEFFPADRKRKAADWATTFMRNRR